MKIMDRTQSSYELPMLNRGTPYVPEAGRTREDDEALVYDAASTLKKRTHISQIEFERIYIDTMRFFAIQERLQFIQYQSGQKPAAEFYRDCAAYLQRNFEAMKNENDFNIMMNRISLAMFQYDVLQPLIDNKNTSDIKVCAPNDIRVRVKGKAYKSNATFIDDADLFRFVEGLGIRNKVDIKSRPMITFTDRHDENYILRFSVSSPMVNAVDYPYLHIRKVPKTKPYFDDLIQAGMLTEDLKLYLIDRAKTSRGIVFAGPPGCVDRDTEFFNGKEWKSIADYEDGEQVLQFDANTGTASLVVPEQYINEPCNEMWRFHASEGIDQMLSDEHRVLYYPGQEENLQEISADVMAKKQNTGCFEGGIETCFSFSGDGMPLTDEELTVMLMVIRDGSFSTKHSKNRFCIIRLKEDRKKMELEWALMAAKIRFRRVKRKNGCNVYTFIAPRREEAFGADWYQCTNRQLSLICKNILSGEDAFVTTQKASADFIQFAFAACGQKAVIETRLKKTKDGAAAEYRVTAFDGHITDMNSCHENDGTGLKAERVKTEDGRKYCFTVPAHALVLRRNGKIFITGNSGKTTALNAFIEYIPKTRESLVIQENDELYTNQSGFMFKHVCHGFQGEPEVTLEELAKLALVEGCNEFIIGEVKGGEMRYAMTLLNAGGYAALTVHSTNAYETLNKLADLVKYGSDYSYDEARQMLKTFDTVVYMEGYKIREILECTGYDTEKHEYEYIHIYRYMS